MEQGAWGVRRHGRYFDVESLDATGDPALPIACSSRRISVSIKSRRSCPIFRLWASHLYASPFLKARPGSKHGYDTVDPSLLNPEFGGEDAFARLSDALERADMGLILDFVPNHMGVGYADNAWWLDVLEWGQKSPYASVFDIDWMTLPNRRAGGVLLPILGRPYGEALEQGEIELRYDAHEGSFSLWYFDHRLPVRPSRYPKSSNPLFHSQAEFKPCRTNY